MQIAFTMTVGRWLVTIDLTSQAIFAALTSEFPSDAHVGFAACLRVFCVEMS